MWASLSEALNLVVGINLVVLQDGELDLLVLVWDLLWGSVGSLLLLLATTDHWNDNIEGAFLYLIFERREKQRAYLSDTGLRNGGLNGKIRAGVDEASITRPHRVLE